MELRHLRYFIAVAEEGSLTLAAEKRLHTAQPSLSRQIRDLEYEVGVQLMSRSVHGIELTAAGRAFLDHARLALAQANAAVETARRAAQPLRKTFAIGFQTGHEINWLPRVMHVLRDELKDIQVTISSDYSPDLAEALVRGQLDMAFLRVEPAADERLGEVRRIVARYRDLDVLQLVAQHMHGPRQPVYLVTGLETDGERLSCRQCGPARRFRGCLCLSNRQPSMVEEGAPSGG